MKKEKILEKIADYESEIVELKELLKKPQPEEPKKVLTLRDKIKGIDDIYTELKRKKPTLEDFAFLPEKQRKKRLAQTHIDNITELFNQGHIFNWNDSREYKYFVYLIKNAAGWSFYVSGYYSSGSAAEVGYYKTREDSDFCGKLFLDIYIDCI